MLRRDGLAKVLDFGLAKLIEQATPPAVSFARVTTQPGVVMGTISYMSPEQARGLDMGPQTDLFSLGVVMYELLAGHAPFEGETTSDVLVALLNGEPRPLSRYLPLLPDALQEIVSRALAKPVEQRYQTARELAGDLKRVKEEMEFAAKLKGPQSEPAALLALKVGGSASAADRTTFKTAAPAGPTTSHLTKLRGVWRRRGKALAAAIAAVVLVITGVVWGKSWWALLGSAPNTIDSVAVLPFANVGSDPQMEYLPDGITEGLIDNLSQLPGLTVMARGTVFTYKGREVDPRQVGQALRVRAVVTGRVERRGERLIVHAEMADAASGARLWGEQFDRPAAELLSVHQEITREISDALRRRLSNAQQQQLARRYAANSEAYHLYLRGRFLLSQGSRPSYEKAQEYFHQALALDPNYALAYAGIADFYSASSAQFLPPSEAMPKARRAAQTALRLDESLPEAHVSMAIIANWADWNWAESEREYQRALALNPNLTSARASHTGLLTQLGQFREALQEARRAEQLDPLSPHSLLTVANTLYFARQYDQAIAQLQKLIEVVPSFGGAYRLKGQMLSLMGKHQEALAELRHAVRLNPQDTHRAWLGYGCARAGQRDEAMRILRELKEKAAKEHVSPVYLARIHLALGEIDQAFAWLRKAFDERSDHILVLGIDPIYDPLRSDPRYVQLLRDIGLPLQP
jgi:TolB-like protein/Tfp pilus assembly protein PilF